MKHSRRDRRSVLLPALPASNGYPATRSDRLAGARQASLSWGSASTSAVQEDPCPAICASQRLAPARLALARLRRIRRAGPGNPGRDPARRTPDFSAGDWRFVTDGDSPAVADTRYPPDWGGGSLYAFARAGAHIRHFCTCERRASLSMHSALRPVRLPVRPRLRQQMGRCPIYRDTAAELADYLATGGGYIRGWSAGQCAPGLIAESRWSARPVLTTGYRAPCHRQPRPAPARATGR
jgi:hypothetical protein